MSNCVATRSRMSKGSLLLLAGAIGLGVGLLLGDTGQERKALERTRSREASTNLKGAKDNRNLPATPDMAATQLRAILKTPRSSWAAQRAWQLILLKGYREAAEELKCLIDLTPDAEQVPLGLLRAECLGLDGQFVASVLELNRIFLLENRSYDDRYAIVCAAGRWFNRVMADESQPLHDRKGLAKGLVPWFRDLVGTLYRSGYLKDRTRWQHLTVGDEFKAVREFYSFSDLTGK